ncbi:MAG: sigma-70 family RNA polymerase sigma factor [Bryobacteraceae bacterium]
MTREQETELTRSVLAGDSAAFDAFVEHFRAKVFHYTWLMCGQREDAEEVAQDTLLGVFQHLDDLREPERVRPWIFRIARNACLTKRRQSVFAPARELSLDEFVPVVHGDGQHRHIDIADWSSLPEDTVLQSELKEQLEGAIAALPDNYKSVVLLRDVEALSTEETAQILAVSTDTVKTRLHRARLALRQKLDQYVNTARPGGGR